MTPNLTAAIAHLDEAIASTVEALADEEAPRQVLGVCIGSLRDLRFIYTHHEEL